jgi:hypothetical protein
LAAKANNLLTLSRPYLLEFRIPKDGSGSGRIVSLHVSNMKDTETYDDVIVELRLPAGVAFVGDKKTYGLSEAKPVFGLVRLPLDGPLHPGAEQHIGYVKKHFDCDDVSAGLFGASSKKGVIEWKLAARDIPPASGEIDVQMLDEPEP